MTKPPKAPAKPVIFDRHDIPEVLSDCLEGAAYLEGLVCLTFSVERIVPGDSRPDAPTYKIITSRIALTKTGFDQLVQAIPKLQTALALADKKPAGGSQPN